MKKLYTLQIAALLTLNATKAQTTALDFTQNDCYGHPHNLYSELDSGYVVFMEFVMNCGSCIYAAMAIESLIDDLNMEFPGKIRFYQFSYTASFTCIDMLDFQSTNGFSGVPFEANDHMMAYYGGFGMPTVAVAAGSSHSVLFSNVGFSISDTTQIGISVRNFFATLDKKNSAADITKFSVYPNPANGFFTVAFRPGKNTEASIQLTDLSGRIVRQLFNGIVSKDFNQLIDLSSISSGSYFVNITMDGETINKKISIAH